jgi:hypothetical protein
VAVVGRERGLTVLEVVVALAVLTIIVTSVMVGERSQLAGVVHSFDELAASRAAAGRLEELAGAPLVVGETTFDVDAQALPGCVGVQRIREVTPGLFEVSVRIERARAERAVQLTTLMVREEAQ